MEKCIENSLKTKVEIRGGPETHGVGRP
jgi:hypothetical protein